MINQPPENSSTSLESKYSLVVAVAKRARQIVAQRDPGVVLVHKPVIIALDEIAQGRIRIVTKPEQEAESLQSAETQPVPETPSEPVVQEVRQAPDEPESTEKPQQ